MYAFNPDGSTALSVPKFLSETICKSVLSREGFQVGGARSDSAYARKYEQC